MAQHERGAGFDRPHNGPRNTPRLRLKRKAFRSGYVDGAWWPHSNDLAAELPDLLAVLSVRLGAIARVAYSHAEWTMAPRKLHIENQLVRLDGYDRQPAHTLRVTGRSGWSVVLLIVPVQTHAQEAHGIMMAAATLDDASNVDSLLATARNC